MKKSAQKILSIILCMIMLFGAAPLNGIAELDFAKLNLFSLFETKASAEEVPTSGTCGENLAWNFEEETGTLTISGGGNMMDYTSFADTPWSGFQSNIKAVVIDSSTTSIGSYAFSGCKALISVSFTSGLQYINKHAFDGCASLRNIDFPNSLKGINEFAFQNCINLRNLFIPINVVAINEGAFRFCSGLTQITVSDSNSKYKSMNNCLVDISAQKVILGCNNSTIPTSMITLFGLSPKFVTSIGDYAFANCSFITSISIPFSISSISSTAFYGCSGIESISSTSLKYNNSGNCLVENSSNTLILGCKSSVIPTSGVSKIGNYAFCGCKNLQMITIPNNITDIGDYAFSGCTALTDITIPESVISIGESAFSGVLNINYIRPVTGSPWGARFENRFVEYPFVYTDNTRKELLGSAVLENETVQIPDGVETIGASAFSDCTWIRNVLLPSGLKKIREEAFAGCVNALQVFIPDSVKQIDENAFLDVNLLICGTKMYATGSPWGAKSAITYCGDNTIWSYDSQTKTLTISGSGPIADYFTEPVNIGGENVTVTGAPWENHYRDVKNLVIGEGVTSIGAYAFYGCSGLENISFSSSVSKIGTGAFENCFGLRSINVPDSNPYFRSSGNCLIETQTGILVLGLSNTIPDDGSVTGIGKNAFSGCDFTDITIPQSVTSIGDYAFSNCTGLNTVTISDSVTSIGYCAFLNCSSLRDVYYSGNGDDWYGIDIINKKDEDYDPYPNGNACLFDASIHLGDDSVMSKSIFTYTVLADTVVITGLADSSCEKAAIPNIIN